MSEQRRTGRTDPDAMSPRAWACDRKVPFKSEAQAREVAAKRGHRAFRCSYGRHWHTADLPGSFRFARFIS